MTFPSDPPPGLMDELRRLRAVLGDVLGEIGPCQIDGDYCCHRGSIGAVKLHGDECPVAAARRALGKRRTCREPLVWNVAEELPLFD